MNYLQFAQSVKKGIKSAYVVNGDDSFLISKVVYFITKYSGVNLPELDFQKFDSENFDVDKLVLALEGLPFSGDRRVVVFSAGDKLTEGERKKIKAYLENPNEMAVFVMIASEKEDFSFVSKAEKVVCSRLDPPILQKYIVEEVKKAKREMNDASVQLLIEYSNCNLAKISTELQKLVSSKLENEEITESDVENLVTKDKEFQVFALSDAITKNDADLAVEILDELLERKEDPIKLLSLISSNFRRMFFASTSSFSSGELAGYLDSKEGAIQFAKMKSKNFSSKQLKLILDKGEEVDYFVKSGKMPAETALYFLVFSIFEIIN